jgi:predicted metal-dependent peptidase
MRRSDVEHFLRMARTYAAEKLPWFAPALYATRLVITDAIPFPAGIDEGMRVYFNPQWVAQIRQQASEQKAILELAWIWVHEICHCLREHRERAREKQAEPSLWNIAADLEINDAEWQGLERPSGVLLPQRIHLPSGKLAEFYYDELVKTSREGKSFSEPSQGLGKSLTFPVWDEGSGVHGQKREWELPDDEPQAPPLTELEQEVIRRTVAEEIVRHKDRDVIPAGWLRWAEEVLKPKVDWQELLKRKVRGAITIGTGQRIDYSLTHPHRRAEIYEPVLPPSLQGDFVPRVVCVVDTSGSIGERELAQALAEVRRVLESLRVPIVVLPCDAVPYEPIKVFTSSQLLRLHLKGGGGTNMVAGIEAALKLKPTPDVVIVLTDGYTPFPPQRYKVPVIFGIFAPNRGSEVPKPPMPPWRESDVVVIPLTSP